MTKNEYIAWKASRGEPSTWDLNLCQEADELIKETALANLEGAILHIPWHTREYVQLMARCHYGSMLKCYPDWI